MTDIEHIDITAPEYASAPRGLRDYVKTLQEALQASNAELDSYRTQAAEAVLTDALAGYRNPDKVQRDLLSDSIDPLDREAVKGWLAENGDDYARHGLNLGAFAEEAAAHQRLQQADLTSPADMTRLEAAMAEVTPEMTGDDIKAVYKKHGL